VAPTGIVDHDDTRIARLRRRKRRPQARQVTVAPDDPACCPAAFTHPGVSAAPI
jgi:hypothetical protein